MVLCHLCMKDNPVHMSTLAPFTGQHPNVEIFDDSTVKVDPQPQFYVGSYVCDLELFVEH